MEPSHGHSVRNRRCLLLIAVLFISFILTVIVYALITQDNRTDDRTDNCTDVLSGTNGNVSFANHTKNFITVVTAYYRVPSKRSHCQYLLWMANFLRNIPCHLYIFTSAQEYSVLASMRMDYTDRTRIIVQELDELEEYSNMFHWKRIKSLDPETYHSPELYLIWNEKWHFVQKAMTDNIFQSDYFIWCDIGSFRSPQFLPELIRFPDEDLLRRKFPDQDRILLTLIRPFSSEEFVHANGSLSDKLRAADTDHVAGGFAAGHQHAWRLFIARYYEMQNYFFQENLNAGKEQNVLNALVLKYPGNFRLLVPEEYFNGYGDSWFYFQYYLSQ